MQIVRETSIVLIGFMGSGKTTIGKELASKLGRKFIDTDEQIEKEFSMPITEIFQTYGEQVFRQKEREMITELASQENLVLSLGGGAFLQSEIRDACMQTAIVVYLDSTWETWKERMDLLIDSRPLLQNKSLTEIQQLFRARQEIYQSHHIKVITDDLTIHEMIQQIIDSRIALER